VSLYYTASYFRKFDRNDRPGKNINCLAPENVYGLVEFTEIARCVIKALLHSELFPAGKVLYNDRLERT